MSILDQARTQYTDRLNAQAQAEQEQQARLEQQQYDHALAQLARLVPAVLGVPFNPADAQPLVFNSSHRTATVTIEGRVFRPETARATVGGGQRGLNESEITRLEVQVTGIHWTGNNGTDWLAVGSLADLGAALKAEEGGKQFNLSTYRAFADANLRSSQADELSRLPYED